MALPTFGSWSSPPGLPPPPSSREKRRRRRRWDVPTVLALTSLILNLMALRHFHGNVVVTGNGPAVMMTAGGADAASHAPPSLPPRLEGGEVGCRTAQNKTTTATEPRRSREVEFLRFGLAYPRPRGVTDGYPTPAAVDVDIDSTDAFSASWWQSRENFLRYTEVETKSASPEGASFEVFTIRRGSDVRMTRDWTDLAVEHMSKWWKVALCPQADSGALERIRGRILDIFRRYVYSDDRRLFLAEAGGGRGGAAGGDWFDVAQSTVAVIAYMTDRGPRGDELTRWSLAATIMSLVQCGVGRVVVSGVDEHTKDGWEERRIVREAFGVVNDAVRRWSGTNETAHGTTAAAVAVPRTELEYCACSNATTGDKWSKHNIPKASLKRLRRVLLNRQIDRDPDDASDDEVRRCWTGPSGQDRWRYVFLGEPDLILTTRPSSLDALGRALKQGRVLVPHRLQPVPHASDFDFGSGDGGANDAATDAAAVADDRSGLRMLPNSPPHFDHVVGIDVQRDGSCCDAGRIKPLAAFGDCGTFWWMCGFGISRKNAAEKEAEAAARAGERAVEEKEPLRVAMEAHKRLLTYPLARLVRGTGVVFAGAESGRMCHPGSRPCDGA